MRKCIAQTLVICLLFTGLTVSPVNAHRSSHCGHKDRGLYNVMQYRGSHTHKFYWNDGTGNVKITTEHHHSYRHLVLTPLGWLTDHWKRHKRCPKH